jgi:hypothetical protein
MKIKIEHMKKIVIIKTNLLKKTQLRGILNENFSLLALKSKKYDKILMCYDLILDKNIQKIKDLDKSYEHIYLRLLYIDKLCNNDPTKLSIDIINETRDNQIIYILFGIINDIDLNMLVIDTDLLQILTEYYKSLVSPTSNSESIAGGFINKYNKYDKYKLKYEKYKLKYINLKKQITNI